MSISIFDTVPQIGAVISDFRNLYAFSVNAVDNTTANEPTMLNLGATSSVNIETFDKVNMRAKNGMTLFNTRRTESAVLEAAIFDVALDAINDVTRITTGSNAPSRPLAFSYVNQVNFNNFSIKEVDTTSVIHTDMTSLTIDNTTRFTSNVNINGHMVAYGSVFGCNLNVWQDKDSGLMDDPVPTALKRVGFGIHMNSQDQLEFVKTCYFNDDTTKSKRVAVFGMQNVEHGAVIDDAQYLVFDALNESGVSTQKNGALVSAVSPLDRNMFVNGSNVGVGITGAAYRLDVEGTGRFTSNVYMNSNLVVSGHITGGSAAFESFAIDTFSANVANLVTVNSFQINGSNALINRARFTDTVNMDSNLSVTGTVSARFAIFDNLTLSDTSLPNLIVSSNITAESTYVQDGNYNMLSCSNLTMTSNLDMGGLDLTNVGTAVIDVLDVRSQVITPGADYAELITKADPSATFTGGDLVGLDASGKVTDKFSESIKFMIVSTQPSILGGHIMERPADGDAEALAQYEELMATQVKIAFCGRVKFKCAQSASPVIGSFVVPTSGPDDTIASTVVTQSDLTLPQYVSSVGQIINIDWEGEPLVIVKQ
jgi:hypothetical protein